MLRSICVFCGSNPGSDPRFTDAARDFGALLALTQRTLVFGGGRVGLMGALADAALAEGGTVIGVIPEQLAEKELAHLGLSELYRVRTMHERKALMAARADAFVALPGGLGTLEELFEVWTWAQLGFHEKPVGVLDVAGFFRPFVALVRHLEERGFVRRETIDAFVVDDDPERLLERLEEHEP